MGEDITESTYIPGIDKTEVSSKYIQCKERPRYALESNEDKIYHDPKLTGQATEPEYHAFFDKVWVFNRTMEWMRLDNGNIICYSNCRNLALTGVNQASKWISDPINLIEEAGEFTHFVKQSKSRYRDCIVLPGFQFENERFSIAKLIVTEVSTDWQLCLFVKGRSGPPVYCTDWQNGNVEIELNLQDILRKKGYNLHFVELHFVLGMWNPSIVDESAIVFNLSLHSEAAIVPCLPVSGQSFQFKTYRRGVKALKLF